MASAPSAAGESEPPAKTRPADDPGPPSTPQASTDVSPAAGHAADPGPGAGRQDEKSALLHLATRLKADHPTIEASVVDDTVTAAHDAFRQAKIRTYVPILVERRARNLLVALERERAASPTPPSMSAPATAPDIVPDIVPATATVFRVVSDQGPTATATGVER
ncbi:three-helix bundle dimerization domain-containing protein [Streptomyces sp. NPDC048643]|uniref:three-helix bundle dimerization domain-containing protein n=1 Tax=Streptomyces sp. NPDC048643 TaxID=3155637 RepID=UPI0034133C13